MLQEIGRAGRDGMPSQCIAFYTPADFSMLSFYLCDISSAVHREHVTKMAHRFVFVCFNFLPAVHFNRLVANCCVVSS